MIEQVSKRERQGSLQARPTNGAGHPLGDRFESVLRAIADGVTVQDRSGRLVYANEAAARIIGFPSPDDLLEATADEILDRFELFAEDGSTLSPAALPGRLALAGRAAEPLTVRFRVRATGEEHWSIVKATPLPGADGSVEFAINTFHDITARVRAEERLRASERRHRDLTEAMPQIAWMTDERGSLLHANARWTEYTGRPARPGRPLPIEEVIHPDDRGVLAERWAEALASGERLEQSCRLLGQDGAHRWHLVRALPIREDGGRIRGWIATSTDIDEAKRAEDAFRLLAEANVRLDETLDLERTLQTVAEVVLPTIADLCFIDLLGRDGEVRRATVAHADPGDAALAARLRQFPTDLSGRGPGAQALRSGSALIVPELTPEYVESAARGPEHARLLREIGVASLIVVPLAAHDRTIGAMLLVTSRSGRRYTEADLPLATEIGRRASLAIANAELYEAEQAARREAEAAAGRTARLQEMTARLAEARDRGTAVDLVVRSARGSVGADWAVVALAPDGANFGVAAWDAADGTAPTAAGSPIDPRIIDAVRSDEAAWEPGRVILPIRSGSGVVGALVLGFTADRRFDPVERAYLASLAGLCGQAFERVELAEARERLLLDLAEQRGRLETVLREMPVGVILAEAPSGRSLYVNEEGERVWGGPLVANGLEDYATLRAQRPDGTPYAVDDWPLARAIRSGETVANELIEISREDGSHVTLSCSAGPIRDQDDAIVAAVVTFSDVTDRIRHQETQRFLAEASAVLGDSLDYEETLRRVARLAVPRIGDWCAVEIVSPDGEVEWLTVEHVDPAKVELARELRRRYPPDPNATVGVAAVIRSGQPELAPVIDPARIEAVAVDAEHRELLLRLHLRSYMCVPLRIGDRTIGAITFVGAESGRTYGPDDLPFAESLAARASAAIENARLFREVARHHQIHDATPDAVLVVDPNTLGIAYANEGAAAQAGRPREALIGLGTGSLLTMDHDRLAQLLEPIVAGEVRSRSVTTELRRDDGATIPVEVVFSRLAPAGEPIRIVAVARDITERLEAQARLQGLAESEHARAAELNAVIRAIGDGVFVYGDDGTIRLANPAAEEMFPEVVEQTFDDIMTRLDFGAEPPLEMGVRAGPIEVRAAGGNERWIEVSTYPVPVQAGPSPASREVIVMLRDVTEVRQRQAVRDAFIGVLSHELRTPVTTIYGGSKVLSRADSALSEDRRREVFEDIQAEAERLHRLVEDVIALNRFGEDSEDIGRDPILVQRVLPAVVESERARWPGVDFFVRVPPGIPTVWADGTYLEQVIRNLLANAAKYAGPGSTVQATVERAGSEVVVRVLDDGPGFPPEDSERLFDLFFRSASTSAKASGAGIGLFVCARLIRAMGGRIWAAPRPEGGAEFGFALRMMTED